MVNYLRTSNLNNADSQTSSTLLTAVSVVSSVVVLAVAIVVVVYCRRRWIEAEERALRVRAKISGFTEENEVQTSTNAKPDMSSLRLCKASELQHGEMIGSGAFGKVYKGIFLPERENIKIPVAIKELSESSNPDSSTELLEEARIMAAVVHPCCIRIMAVCMTKQMMLVTPLMPFGSLLDYIRLNRANVGSHAMLMWARQIAEGMEYLETLDIVHRDLAARNVLVHSAQQVKITDFGLAKIMDANADNYQATGGKLPIKWLALESIRQRIFTHNSDVWSYGVTLWELFTYGERPFNEIKVIDFAAALERGDRLPQPAICSIDVYMLMLKCWTIDADSRLSFTELKKEFSKMSNDPQRYLSVQNDTQLELPTVTMNAYEMLRSTNVQRDDLQVISADDYYEQVDNDQTCSGEKLQEQLKLVTRTPSVDRSGVDKHYIDVLPSPGVKPTLELQYNDSDTAVRYRNVPDGEKPNGEYYDDCGPAVKANTGDDGYLVPTIP